MNYYYIKRFTALRGMKLPQLGDIFTESSNEKTLQSISATVVNSYRYIPEDKAVKVAQRLRISPEWLYFTPVLFTASDFYAVWDDYLLRKDAPLMEKGEVQGEFVIGERDHLPSWFNEYFDKKKQLVDKQITNDEWTEFAYNCLKPLPEDVKYESNAGEIIKRFMRTHDIDLSKMSERLCENLYEGAGAKKRSNFLGNLKTALDTGTVPKNILISFSEITATDLDICFCQFELDSPESVFNFFVTCDLMLAPVYLINAREGEDDYRKRLVITDAGFRRRDVNE